MDAQAIDRAHRIGQKKQVRIFRLVTENTVDDRIVKRAEIKLRLDRMVIQSGHVIRQNKDDKFSKQAMLNIIRFDAEHILSDNFEEVIDIDIEQILRDGTIRTNAANAEYAKMKEEELRKHTLEEASSSSMYNFEGIDYRQITSAPKQIEQVEHPTGIRSARIQQINEPGPSSSAKLVTLQEFQFFPPAIYLLCVPGTFKIDMANKLGKKNLFNTYTMNLT